MGENPLLDDDGSVLGYLHRLRCRAADRLLVRELSSSRAQLDEAQAIAKVGSWEHDLHTGQVSWSRQMYTLLGQDPATFVPSPQSFLDQVVVSDLQRVTSRMGEAEQGRTGNGVDFRIRRVDGTIAWVRGLGQVTVADDGTPTRVRGTLQDVRT